jgi:hypothetical protein
MRTDNGDPSTAEPFRWRDALVCLLLAGVMIAGCGPYVFDPRCGEYHDDAIYLSTAKALAEGEGYRLAHLPGSPPQTKYPPLYPALVALLWKVGPEFPADLPLLKGLSLLCGIATLALAYLFLVRFRYASRNAAFAAGLLCATASAFLVHGVLLLSEMPFSVLLMVALWRLESRLASPAVGVWQAFADGVLLALSYLCRSVGIVLIPVGLLLLWWARRPLRWVLLGIAIVLAPWLLWMVHAVMAFKSDPVQGYYTDYAGWWLSFGLPVLARVVSANVAWVVTGLPSLPLEGVQVWLAQTAPGVWRPLFTALGAVVLAGLLGDLRRGRAMPACLAAYLVLVCIWPWAPHRFLIPLLPLTTVYLTRAVGQVAAFARTRAAPRSGERGYGAGLAAWVTLVAANVVSLGETPLVHSRQESSVASHSGCPVAWCSYEALFDWLRENTDPEDVLVSEVDPMLYLYTGRRGVFPVVCPPQSRFYELPAPPGTEEVPLRILAVHRPRFLVLTPYFLGEPDFDHWVTDLRQRYGQRVREVYRVPDDPRFAVYRLDHPLDDSPGGTTPK